MERHARVKEVPKSEKIVGLLVLRQILGALERNLMTLVAHRALYLSDDIELLRRVRAGPPRGEHQSMGHLLGVLDQTADQCSFHEDGSVLS